MKTVILTRTLFFISHSCMFFFHLEIVQIQSVALGLHRDLVLDLAHVRQAIQDSDGAL